MSGMLIWIFGLLGLYLAVAEVVARIRYDGANTVLCLPPWSRDRLLSEIRRFFAENGISEEWFMAHGGEKESISCLPGSIFGRCVKTVEFGHRQPFGSLELANGAQLRRIYARRADLCAYWHRNPAVVPVSRGSLAGQSC